MLVFLNADLLLYNSQWHSVWWWCLDTSGNTKTFSSPLQKNQGRGTASPLSPFEAALLCRSKSRFHRLQLRFIIFPKTQQYVRIYNLSEQKLLKTLLPGIKWISSMDVHPSGDHLIVGGYDRKLCWFDLELSEKPFKVLRYGLSRFKKCLQV